MDPNDAPNPLDVIAATLRGVTTVDPEADSLAIFNALLEAPADTRRMMAAAMLNSFAEDDTVVIVTKAPDALPKNTTQVWWPMLPHPAVLNSLQDGAASATAKPPAMAKELPRTLRLV